MGSDEKSRSLVAASAQALSKLLPPCLPWLAPANRVEHKADKALEHSVAPDPTIRAASRRSSKEDELLGHKNEQWDRSRRRRYRSNNDKQHSTSLRLN